MTKRKILKDLLKINLDELNQYLNSKLKIKFENNKFIVSNEKNTIIFKDKLSNYKLNIESQKEFVFNVVKNIATWAKRIEDLDEKFFKNMIIVNGRYYNDVLGEGIILKNNRIKIDFVDDPKLVEKFGDNRIYYILYEIKRIINEIENNLDENKIRVVFYDYGNEVGFYVDGVTHECVLYIHYIEHSNILKEIKHMKNISDLKINRGKFIVYYSFITKEEIEEAVEFVKKLVKN